MYHIWQWDMTARYDSEIREKDSESDFKHGCLSVCYIKWTIDVILSGFDVF